MSEREAREITIHAVGDVSALVEQPPDARYMLVLAHGAGAGMRHRSLEARPDVLRTISM